MPTYDFSLQARRRDYNVRECSHRDAVDLVKAHHYAKGASNTSVFRHGLYRGDLLVGAALWMPPTKIAALSVSDDWQGVLSLTRLVVIPSEPKNAASILLGASIRLVFADSRWHTLLTYADTRHGHVGTIYKATNWEYLGLVPGSKSFFDPTTGRQVALKSTRSRTWDEMENLGYIRQKPSKKHKFVIRRKRRVDRGGTN